MQKYFSEEFYKKIAQGYINFIEVILINYSEYRNNNKEIIISNLIARSVSLLNSIFKLWEISSEEAAWIIYRCLMDRLFHLHYLIKNNDFNKFEKWSFIKICEMKNKMRSDPLFKSKTNSKEYGIDENDKKRYNDQNCDNTRHSFNNSYH